MKANDEILLIDYHIISSLKSGSGHHRITPNPWTVYLKLSSTPGGQGLLVSATACAILSARSRCTLRLSSSSRSMAS